MLAAGISTTSMLVSLGGKGRSMVWMPEGMTFGMLLAVGIKWQTGRMVDPPRLAL
jgi:hypothetical protein